MIDCLTYALLKHCIVLCDWRTAPTPLPLLVVHTMYTQLDTQTHTDTHVSSSLCKLQVSSPNNWLQQTILSF